VDHRDRVAEEWVLREHVDLPEMPVHVPILSRSEPERIFP
jgi:hypothetical protein